MKNGGYMKSKKLIAKIIILLLSTGYISLVINACVNKSNMGMIFLGVNVLVILCFLFVWAVNVFENNK